jgi:hypothetical protein
MPSSDVQRTGIAKKPFELSAGFSTERQARLRPPVTDAPASDYTATRARYASVLDRLAVGRDGAPAQPALQCWR